MFRSPKDHPQGVRQALLDVLPEDGSLGTETCRSFIGNFNILMCVNMF